MTHTFVLRSSDNTLVWVKNPPVKPAFKESIYGQGTYQVLLTQAIADGVKVADEQRIIKCILNDLDVRPGSDWKDHIQKDFPYDLDVEMEIREVNANDSQREDGKYEYRKLAYLVEPKEETYHASPGENKFNLKFCKKCYQMTNHDLDGACLKCKQEPKDSG